LKRTSGRYFEMRGKGRKKINQLEKRSGGRRGEKEGKG